MDSHSACRSHFGLPLNRNWLLLCSDQSRVSCPIYPKSVEVRLFFVESQHFGELTVSESRFLYAISKSKTKFGRFRTSSTILWHPLTTGNSIISRDASFHGWPPSISAAICSTASIGDIDDCHYNSNVTKQQFYNCGACIDDWNAAEKACHCWYYTLSKYVRICPVPIKQRDAYCAFQIYLTTSYR